MFVAEYSPSGLPHLLGIRPEGGGVPIEATAAELQQELLRGCCPLASCPPASCPPAACPACPSRA